MQLITWLEKFQVTLLVDSDSTHNFINSNIVSKVGLKPNPILPFEVKVARGDKLKCEALIREIKMNVHGVGIVADLHIQPLVGLDSLGKVIHDYHNMTIEFKLGSMKQMQIAPASKEIKPCKAIMFEKLCKDEAHCFAIVVAKEGLMRQVENMGQESTLDELDLLPEENRPILEAYRGVLEVPSTLPPFKEFDHHI